MPRRQTQQRPGGAPGRVQLTAANGQCIRKATLYYDSE